MKANFNTPYRTSIFFEAGKQEGLLKFREEDQQLNI